TIKEKMLSANAHVRWLPDFAKERMRNHLAESPDWCISNQRFWGIPLPIWVCGSCERYEVVGSAKELDLRMTNKIELNDLHKNVVDGVELHCSCGSTMRRVPDLLNVWVDSGIGPWASLGYPHKNKELFERLWPVDLINESQDQVRGWFYALLFMGIATFDKKPYETACLNGWVLDAKGEKMSKSLGNVVDAQQMVDELGADVLRLYVCSGAAPWGVYRFSFDEAKKLHAHMNILLNLKNFVDMYGLMLSTGTVKGDANRWIVSRVNGLVRDVTDDLENFRFHYAGRKLTDFLLNDFSRTYMKTAKEGDAADVGRAVGTVLDTYLRLLAPICPFISEYVYQELFGGWKRSIHREGWPSTDPKSIDERLERAFSALEALTETALSLRQDAGVGLRYPIKGLVLSGPKELTDAVLSLEGIVKNLLNVKEVTVGKARVSYEVKLNYATAGPKYGKDVRKIEAELKKADPSMVMKTLDKNGSMNVGGVELTKEEIKATVTSEEGRAFVTELGAGVVVLDTKETAGVMEESLVRELSRDVQQTRKALGLKMKDSVTLALHADKNTTDVLKRWAAELRAGTGSTKLLFDTKLKSPKMTKYKGWIVEFEVM
ncbi:MAG: class I tRNA ligase family protein, partial [Candidatus Aenigmarchaeota archaeon]|nr:class I tRNA ligase family protein [Candidatus Aenigmarchaeota archaeon]